VRQQYYFRPSAGGYDAWDVNRLVALSEGLPVRDVPLSSIAELDTPHWFGADETPMTVRVLVQHVQLINDADLSFPVILGSEGQLMDGMHRVARAVLDGRTSVSAVQFDQPLEPDYRDVQPTELPY
jgi:hypothetical protein